MTFHWEELLPVFGGSSCCDILGIFYPPLKAAGTNCFGRAQLLRMVLGAPACSTIIVLLLLGKGLCSGVLLCSGVSLCSGVLLCSALCGYLGKVSAAAVGVCVHIKAAHGKWVPLMVWCSENAVPLLWALSFSPRAAPADTGLLLSPQVSVFFLEHPTCMWNSCLQLRQWNVFLCLHVKKNT